MTNDYMYSLSILNLLPRCFVFGALLLNLGTPKSPLTADVRVYLREFLSDPRVIDIHPIARWILVQLIIAPTRAPKSAEAYQQVWTDRGSPLLFHGLDLRDKVASILGQDWKVVLGMRYGQPNMTSALEELRDVDHIVVLPLYPQYASASTGTALEELYRLGGEGVYVPHFTILPAFYEHMGFISSVVERIEEIQSEGRPDHILFSYHGLPVHQLPCAESSLYCVGTTEPCPSIDPRNKHCYRAQCYATTRKVVEQMGLKDGTWSVSFQSRLGKRPWIQPYTDVHLDELVKQGVRRLAVVCPSFVADCLETLEEIAIRGKEQWEEAGGEWLELIPCVNSQDSWAKAVADMFRTAHH